MSVGKSAATRAWLEGVKVLERVATVPVLRPFLNSAGASSVVLALPFEPTPLQAPRHLALPCHSRPLNP